MSLHIPTIIEAPDVTTMPVALDLNDFRCIPVYSRDGKILAFVGRESNAIEVWDVYANVKLNTLCGHEDVLLVLAFSPDGEILASGSKDKTVRLWSVLTGSLLMAFSHDDVVLSLAFHPNGENLASCSLDGTIRLWHLNSAYRLLHDFDSELVSNVLKFLWGMEMDSMEFKENPKKPRLLPLDDYYFSYDTKYRALLDAPLIGETKLDQVVRFLEEQCAYKDPEKRKQCEAQKP